MLCLRKLLLEKIVQGTKKTAVSEKNSLTAVLG